MYLKRNKKTNIFIGALIVSVVILIGTINDVMANIESDFKYKRINNNEAEITEYSGTDKDVVIPKTLGGYSVTAIGVNAFSRNQLTSVTIPETVRNIGISAFENNQLTSITIPEGVINIDGYAFSGNRLTSIIIPDSLKNIGDHVFSHNEIESVIIPKNVTNIGEDAFSANRITSLVIQEGVKYIWDYAFYDNYLVSVTIPGSMTSIGEGVFRKNNLTSAKILGENTTIGNNPFSENPDNFTMIGYDTSTAKTHADENGYIFKNILEEWYEWEKVTNESASIILYKGPGGDLVIPSKLGGLKVTDISGSSFQEKELTSVVIPDGVKSIGSQSFRGNSLASVQIPDTVTSIGGWAFQNNKLKEVTIPKGVTTIERDTFRNNHLENVVIPESVKSIGIYAFRSNQIKSVSLANGLVSIEDDAFRFNLLDNVKIPSTVATIGKYTFSDNQLTSVKILGKDTTIDEKSFTNNQDDSADLTIIGYTPSTAEEYANSGGYNFQSINAPNILNRSISTNLTLNGGDLILEIDKEGSTFENINLNLNNELTKTNLGQLEYTIIDNRGKYEDYQIEGNMGNFEQTRGETSTTLPYTELKLTDSFNEGSQIIVDSSGSFVLNRLSKDNVIHKGEISVDEVTFDKSKFIKSGEYKADLTLEIVVAKVP